MRHIRPVPLRPFSARRSVAHNLDRAGTFGPCGFPFVRPPPLRCGMRGLVSCLLISTTLMGFCPSQYCSRHPAPNGFPSDLAHLPLAVHSPRLIFVEGKTAVSCYVAPVRRHSDLPGNTLKPGSWAFSARRVIGKDSCTRLILLMTVRAAATVKAPSADPAMGLASCRVCGHRLGCIATLKIGDHQPRDPASGPYPFLALRRVWKCPGQRSPGYPHKPPGLQRFDESDAWPAR